MVLQHPNHRRCTRSHIHIQTHQTNDRISSTILFQLIHRYRSSLPDVPQCHTTSHEPPAHDNHPLPTASCSVSDSNSQSHCSQRIYPADRYRSKEILLPDHSLPDPLHGSQIRSQPRSLTSCCSHLRCTDRSDHSLTSPHVVPASDQYHNCPSYPHHRYALHSPTQSDSSSLHSHHDPP